MTHNCDLKSANPEWKVGQVAQELGRRWKDLTEEEKKSYEEMAIRDKTRYEQEMRDYKVGSNPSQAIEYCWWLEETGKKPASRMETNAAAIAGVSMSQMLHSSQGIHLSQDQLHMEHQGGDVSLILLVINNEKA